MPSLLKGPRGAHGHLHHAAAGDHRDVTPCPQLRRLAQPERYQRVRHGRLFDTATEAHVHRPIDVERGQRGLIGFVDVRRDDHGHVRKAAHQGQVFEGVVGAARDAERDATGRRANDDPLVGVGDVVAHLLHTAGADERRIAADVRMQTCRRQPGRDANGVLLGNADFDKTLGVTCYIRPNTQQVLRVGREHHGPGITRRHLQQGLAKGEPRLVGGLGPPIGCLYCCRSHHGVSSSASARA